MGRVPWPAVSASWLAPLTCAVACAVAFTTRRLGGAASSVTVLTTAQLKQQITAQNRRLLLLILGRVYDVTKGRQFYGVGEDYHGFCLGVDHTRAFLEVDFEKSGGDDLSAATPGQCLGISSWSDFYEEKNLTGVYPFVGLHEGTFYDGRGEPTDALLNFSHCVARGEAMKAAIAAVSAAALNCSQRIVAQEKTGTWEAFECSPPAVPRRSGLPNETQRCICLVEACEDAEEQCAAWAESGECDANPEFMRTQCARSCGACITDESTQSAISDDEDFPNAPKRYMQCTRRASSCTVRTR